MHLCIIIPIPSEAVCVTSLRISWNEEKKQIETDDLGSETDIGDYVEYERAECGEPFSWRRSKSTYKGR